MWFQSPNCHWCGIKTRLLFPTNGYLPDDCATVDHVIHTYDRESPEQKEHKVLACYGCNHDRGRQRDLEFYYGPNKGIRKDVKEE